MPVTQINPDLRSYVFSFSVSLSPLLHLFTFSSVYFASPVPLNRPDLILFHLHLTFLLAKEHTVILFLFGHYVDEQGDLHYTNTKILQKITKQQLQKEKKSSSILINMYNLRA